MPLIQSFEKSGNYLFRHRSYFPVILLVIAIPVIYFTNYKNIIPIAKILITIVAIMFSLTGFIVRAISIATTPKGTSGRNTEKQVAQSLNKTGIYSLVRHPLYLGNYFIWLGIVVFTFNIYFIVIISLFFWLYYERIMFAEERFLEKKFGKEFLNWAENTPAFFPSFKNYKKTIIPFSFKSILRREYSGFLATVFTYAFIDHLRILFITGKIEYDRISTYILLAVIIVTLILRSLKHHTNILNEEGRS